MTAAIVVAETASAASASIARMFAPIGARFALFSRMFGKVILACRVGAALTGLRTLRCQR